MEFTTNTLIIGCNYHLKWQSNKAMRFILAEVSDNRVRMKTKTTHKSFWCDRVDLIFILTSHNIEKGKEILAARKQKSQLEIL